MDDIGTLVTGLFLIFTVPFFILLSISLVLKIKKKKKTSKIFLALAVIYPIIVYILLTK